MAKLSPKAFYSAHKKLVLALIALVLVAAIGLGIWFFAGSNTSEPVYVYPFQYIGMTEYWGDSQESYGPVTTDKIQTVYLSETQTVTEILVKAGDTVKKGDLILSFDTTLSDLQLERKRLDVEKLKLQLQDAQDDLININNMVPMEEVEFEDTSDADEDLGRTIYSKGYEIYGEQYESDRLSYDGSSQVTPLILWLSDSQCFNAGIVDALRILAGELQWINQELAKEDSEDTEPPEDSEDSEDAQPPENSEDANPPGDPEDTDTGNDETQNTGESQTSDNAVESGTSSSGSESVGSVDVYDFYVVVRVTEHDQIYAAKTTWQGLYVTGNGIRFFNPVVGDPFMTSFEDSYEPPEIDYGSGYTAAQIAQMRSDKEKEIKDLQFKVKMAEAEYKIMQTEVSDGNVYAEIDGEVVSILTEEEAKSTRQPVVKVSGGGGFFVEGFVNELEKDKLTIGQEVTVNDWNTGSTYTGEISSLGDFPTMDGYFNGMGNPNSSYYPFKVFIDGSADLQSGSYVSVMYSTSEGEHGVYLENPFIRTEDGKSYVLVLSPEDTLEQRFVVTGKSLWGSYTEVISGLTPEDLIAFPYGKNVRPGVKAIEGDMSNLYG